MGLFDRFKKDPDAKEEKRPVNPSTFLGTRILAIGFLLYLGYDTFRLYQAGGEEAPSTLWLVLSLIFFIGSSVWIGWISWRQYQRMKAEQEEEAAALLAELEAEQAGGDEYQDAFDDEPEEAETPAEE